MKTIKQIQRIIKVIKTKIKNKLLNNFSVTCRNLYKYKYSINQMQRKDFNTLNKIIKEIDYI